MNYDLNEYRYDLPPELVSQYPADTRSESRLMVVGEESGHQDRRFSDLTEILSPGDLLVLNRTRVINARCRAAKPNGTAIEVFFLGFPADPRRCQVLLKPARRVKPGTTLLFKKSGSEVRVIDRLDAGRAVVDCGNLDAVRRVMEQDGEIPLPPYISRDVDSAFPDDVRYQTVFARDLGAIAAPTAGLHFTPELLGQLNAQGVETCFVTHHVGIGTFRPVQVEDIRQHEMETESYSIEPDAARSLNDARRRGRRIIAVGTTSTRCLESNIGPDGFSAGEGQTDLFIYPGYTFRAIDGLVTNFHLPGSSLILLVAALVGRKRVLSLYRAAIEKKYRFYSYGDAMLIFRAKEELCGL